MENYRHRRDPGDMTTEERLDALADVLAEGFLYLAEHGLLNSKSEAPCSDLVIPPEEGRSSHASTRP